MMNEQIYLTLNNGVKIPQLGFGVFLIKGDEETSKACQEAFKVGYRHIDTAHAYQNERGVGDALLKSGLKREEVFITSKLWPTEYGLEESRLGIDKMLKRLKTPYIDLLLLHQQVGDYMGAYRALEVAYKEGKVRAIGLSNFDGPRLEEVLTKATIKPAVIQVETHPYFPEEELKKQIEPYGIKVESWYPLGHGDSGLLNERLFVELGKKYHKSTVQIILRWHLQEGNIVLPKSTNPEHIKANFEIFDFALSKEEMTMVSKLNKHQRYYNATYEEQKRFLSYHPAD